MEKATLCVIFGGKSSEYEVSLLSSYSVLAKIDREKYDVVTVGITKGGQWYIYEGDIECIRDDTWLSGAVLPVTLDLSNGHLLVFDKCIYAVYVDVYFPIMHGEFCEDGRLQGIFDICGAKYVGCDAFASHICMDKGLTKQVARELGIKVAHEYGEKEKMDYPVFVKPCMCGSSIGVSRVENEAELCEAIALARKYSREILIEEAIEGVEVEVAVLESGDELIVSPVGMVRHGGVFYGYLEKYKSLGNEYIIPAKIGENATKHLGECAKKLFLALDCKGLARFDFFACKNGEVVFNEVNTMPGFTDESMYPMLMQAAGVTFEHLIDTLIENAKCKIQNAKL